MTGSDSGFDLEAHRFIINPRYRLQWEQAQNCYVLLYPEGLIQLSGSAAEILQRCSQATTLSAIAEDLQRQFPDAHGLVEDVREFLHEAQAQQWIVAAQADS